MKKLFLVLMILVMSMPLYADTFVRNYTIGASRTEIALDGATEIDSYCVGTKDDSTFTWYETETSLPGKTLNDGGELCVDFGQRQRRKPTTLFWVEGTNGAILELIIKNRNGDL
jgi:hypothetical protein